jgi:hypothetical protein
LFVGILEKFRSSVFAMEILFLGNILLRILDGLNCGLLIRRFGAMLRVHDEG